MMKKTTLSIIMPVYNEENLLPKSVAKVIAFLKKLGLQYEFILVENGSTDSSIAITDDLARRHKYIKVIHLPGPDYGNALRKGFLASSNTVAANLSCDWVDTEFLTSALRFIRRYPIICASKNTQGSRDERPLIRRLGSKIYHIAVRLLFNISVHDTHGIKVLVRNKTLPVIKKCRFGGEVFDTEFIIRALRAGLAVYEHPVTLKEKRHTRVNVVTRAIRGIYQLLLLHFVLMFERR